MLNVASSVAGSKVSEQPVTGRSKISFAAITLAGLFALLAEYWLFRRHFAHYVAPFFPVNQDQLFTYTWAYHAHFEILKRGLSCLLLDPSLLQSCGPMKGAVVPLLALMASFLGGPKRLALGSVNFFLFAVAEIALACFFARRRGPGAALFALGLFLLSNTHYFPGGGIDDLRLDYAGMVMMGCIFLSALTFLERGGRKNLIVLAVLLALGTLSRSILIFYWLATTAACVPLFFALARVKRQTHQFAWMAMRKRALVLLGIAATIMTLYLVLFWSDFSHYYLQCKVSGEDVMRMHEAGVHDTMERLFYYPRSICAHFSNLLLLATGLLLSAILARRWSSNSIDTEPPGSGWPITILFLSITSSVLLIATAYAPTPIMMGVLTVPLAVWLTEMLYTVLPVTKTFKFDAAVLTFLLGGAFYANQMLRPAFPPHPDVASGQLANALLDDLCFSIHRRVDAPTTIYWPLIHDGLNHVNMRLYWYERFRCEPPDGVRNNIVPAFPRTPVFQIAKEMRSADIVVAPTRLASLPKGTFEYDGMASARAALPEIRKILKQDFKCVTQCNLSNGQWQVGIYTRLPGLKPASVAP